jgi:hypothetical protein
VHGLAASAEAPSAAAIDQLDLPVE